MKAVIASKTTEHIYVKSNFTDDDGERPGFEVIETFADDDQEGIDRCLKECATSTRHNRFNWGNPV
jgi:hypothetical protein